MDQLVFGWSESGLEGRNRLQLVATSAGWREDDRYRRVARRLCRLEAPGERDPIAFGWADLGGRRFAFQRRMVASATGDARRLVAHVVAAPPEELPVDLLLRSFRSAFWWSGDALEPVLAPTDPTALLRGAAVERPAAPGVAMPLLGHLLTTPAGTPIAYEGGAVQMHAALCAIHDAVPELLEAFSCSTYETGQMTTWFDLVGLDGRARPRGTRGCARDATSPRYDAGQLAELAELVRVAVGERDASDAEGIASFRAALHLGERVVSGDREAVAALARRPQTLTVTLGTRLGLRGVTDTLWSSARQSWPRLAMSPPSRVDRLERLAVRAADRGDPTDPRVEASLGAVVRRLHSINPALGPIFVERMLQRRTAGAALPAADTDFLAAALAWAYETALPDEVVDALIGWVEEHLGGALLLDPRVPDPWRAELFEVASEKDLLDVADLAELAVRHPGLLERDGWLPQDPVRVAALLIAEEPLRGIAARAVAARWPVADVVGLGLALAEQGRHRSAAQLLEAAGRVSDRRIDATMSQAVWTMLARLVLDATEGSADLGLFELPWSITRRLQPGSGRWIEQAAQIMLQGRGRTDTRASAWPRLLRDCPPAEQEAVTQVALHDLALTSTAAWSFEGRAEQLQVARLPADRRARVVLTALDRRPELGEESLPAVLLALGAAISRRGPLRLQVGAGLHQETAAQQVARLQELDPEAFARRRRQLPRRVVRWLRAQGALG